MFFPEELFMVLPVLTAGIPSTLLSLAGYVLTAYALYVIAKRRGIGKAWLAWVPVANHWIIGSLSDQYQYLVKGQIKSKRKLLLVLSILQTVLAGTVLVMGAVAAISAFLSGNGKHMMTNLMGTTMAVLGLCVPMLAVSVACIVIRYMAMFDIYRSSDPENSVLYVILSIVANVTEPFFLFFNRNKDSGMPPRKQPPICDTEPAECVY